MSRKAIFLYVLTILSIYIVLKGCWTLYPRLFETVELQAQDGMVRLAHSLGIVQEISPDIVYVDLDDASLSSVSLGPNNPQLYEKIISVLKDAGVAIQLIDIVFVAEDGGELVNTIKAADNVYLPLILVNGAGDKKKEEIIPQTALWKQPEGVTPFPTGSPLLSFNALNNSAVGLGHINCWPDYDGVYRRLPLFISTGKYLVPTLSLQVASAYLQISPANIQIAKDTITLANGLFPDGRTKDISIPYSKTGESRIKFSGPWPQVFGHYSVATILEQGSTSDGIMALRDELEGVIVIVSDVTTGGRDFGPVPFSSYSPLSDLHAQFLNSVLTDSFIKEVSQQTVFTQELIICALLIYMALRLKGYQILTVGAGITILQVLWIFLLLSYGHILYPVVRPTAVLVIGTTAILLIQFINMQQEKQIMKARLMPYFAPSVMDKILASPEMLSNVSKKKLTLLFSDIVAFTEWSSDKEAHEIHETLNRYFQEMSEIVFSFEGTIDKFMGDGMLVFFGDPTPHKDHTQRAVLAALAMQKKAWELKKEWSKTGGMRIRIRIGIHSGDVVVGDMGSKERMDYTVIGSHVNLAQRLESNCAPDRILVTREVYEQLGESFITSSNGLINAKGFSEPIEVYYVDRHQSGLAHTI